MKAIKQQTAVNKILTSKGRFFTATFVKKNGEVRVLNGKFDASSITPVDNNLYNHGFLLVFDAQANGFRCMNIKQMLSITMDGKTTSVL